jgi:hypothetical protein
MVCIAGMIEIFYTLNCKHDGFFDCVNGKLGRNVRGCEL